MMIRNLLRVYPSPVAQVPLQNLYLTSPPREPELYTNFVVSLDGRIAVRESDDDRFTLPRALTGRADQRLFQELGARADVMITSMRYLRDSAARHDADAFPVASDRACVDLHRWRREQGLAPQPALAIVTSVHDTVPESYLATLTRPLTIVTGAGVGQRRLDYLRRCGEVLVAGDGDQVDGRALFDALGKAGYRSIYSIAGPQVFHALLCAGVVDRLYMTHVHRLLAGTQIRTLLHGHLLTPPVDLALHAMYLDVDTTAAAAVTQSFCVYDVVK